MKVLFWNLGYAREFDGSLARFVSKGHRIPSHPKTLQKRTLSAMARLVTTEAPDIFACAELSLGARHNRTFDQHAFLLETLSPVASGFFKKYAHERLAALPFHKGNGNAAYAFTRADISPLHFSRGSKTLLLKITVDGVTLFVVHLSLLPRVRKAQLAELAVLVNDEKGDVVVGGDFNLFGGTKELEVLEREAGLTLASPGTPTFPSSRPCYALDLFLYRSKKKRQAKLRVIESRLSDHLPVVFEF